jgi:hypothetical protein
VGCEYVFLGFAGVDRPGGGISAVVDRNRLPFSEEIGAAQRVIKKLRKRETMTREEFAYAQRIVDIRGNPMALCIPFTLFALSTYYVFGCLEYLQGATPSERTFIGLIPMFTSTNLAIQLLRVKRLKGRLRTAQVVG